MNGQRSEHVLHPEQSSSTITEVAASTSIEPALIVARALAAAAEACATVWGISLGDWQHPTTKIPSFMVATGSSLGCFSRKNPSALRLMENFRPTSSASARGSIAVLSTTISTGTRRCRPTRVSSPMIISLPSSSGLSAISVTSAGRPRTKFVPSSRTRL